ncbi:hypothetical protein AQ843_31275 [Burkholderia pseudomallei]|nr:hypothetical protein AQ842_05595 [Burkholderia pseudomallei]OMY43032.1 hypothetical protein AQ843_31275 [Burkholderia pseudomallei]
MLIDSPLFLFPRRRYGIRQRVRIFQLHRDDLPILRDVHHAATYHQSHQKDRYGLLNPIHRYSPKHAARSFIRLV